MNIRQGRERGKLLSRKHSIPHLRPVSQDLILATGMLVPATDRRGLGSTEELPALTDTPNKTEKAAASQRAWRAAHPDEVKARDKAYRAAHASQISAQKAAYYAANRERILAARAARLAAKKSPQ